MESASKAGCRNVSALMAAFPPLCVASAPIFCSAARPASSPLSALPCCSRERIAGRAQCWPPGAQAPAAVKGGRREARPPIDGSGQGPSSRGASSTGEAVRPGDSCAVCSRWEGAGASRPCVCIGADKSAGTPQVSGCACAALPVSPAARRARPSRGEADAVGSQVALLPVPETPIASNLRASSCRSQCGQQNSAGGGRVKGR